MDFIERWFGFAPDQGDWLLATLLIVLVTVITGIAMVFFGNYHGN